MAKCSHCQRDFDTPEEMAIHDCEANQEFDEEYRRMDSAEAKIIRDMRQRLGDPYPDDPTDLHIHRIGRRRRRGNPEAN